MTKTDPPDVFQAIAERIDPGAKLTRHWPLIGGVSAQIEAIEFALPGRDLRQVVVRRPGAAEWKILEDKVTATEFALQTVLFDTGLSVPEPLFVDVSCSLLPSPYLVMAMIEGTTVVAERHLQKALHQMADFLTCLRNLDVETLGSTQLPRREDPVSGALNYVPDTSSWSKLRSSIAGWETTAFKDSVLHGDFWPGNVLWKENQIAAVIDWEDAAIGTALSDLACCRAELMAMYGESAMQTFTTRYLASVTLEVSDLPLWDVYVSSAALATMADWGLATEVEATRRERTARFLDRAAHKMIYQK